MSRPYYIAHRGNLTGPNRSLENTPDYIDKALQEGFDVEVDIWILPDDTVFLGHDEPEHKIYISFLEERKERLWCHAKNLRAMEVLSLSGFNTFYHDVENYVFTSKGFIWSNINRRQTQNTICVMTKENPKGCVGYCSDFIKGIKDSHHN